MPKQSLTIEVEVPEGWELTGEFRSPESGEVVLKGFLTGNGQAIRVVCSPMARYENCPILRRTPVWKPMTLAKAKEFYASGKSVKGRHSYRGRLYQMEGSITFYTLCLIYFCYYSDREYYRGHSLEYLEEDK